jgi:hypothetical protein
MNAERFSQLVEAYGADARRWPVAEREAAAAFRLARPDEAARLLAEADALDALLDAAPHPVVSYALRERVLAAAAGAGLKAHRPLFGFRPGRLAWLSGGAFAAAACAGIIAGQTLTSHLTADAQADAVLYQASLSAVDDTEVLG